MQIVSGILKGSTNKLTGGVRLKYTYTLCGNCCNVMAKKRRQKQRCCFGDSSGRNLAQTLPSAFRADPRPCGGAPHRLPVEVTKWAQKKSVGPVHLNVEINKVVMGGNCAGLSPKFLHWELVWQAVRVHVAKPCRYATCCTMKKLGN